MASGKLELDEDGRRACFRPAAPRFPELGDVQDLLEPAMVRMAELDKLLREHHRKGAVGRLFARLDAVHSSGAEGSTTTFTDLMEYETSARVAPDVDDAAVVAACSAALELEEGDLSELTLRIHRRLFERSRNAMDASKAGQWKDRINAVGDRSSPGGFFHYTHPRSLKPAIAEWRDFTLASDPAVPEVVRQIASHWMFEHIHPVHDGNGRIGRLLVPMVMRMKGKTTTACVFFGEAVHEDKDLYIEALRNARTSDDWTAWTRLMLGFIANTAKRNIDRMERLLAIESDWEGRIKVRRGTLVRDLAKYALTTPAFTVNDAMQHIGGRFPSVNDAAQHLVEKGILTAPETKRDRIFRADEVLLVFDRFRAQPVAKLQPSRSASQPLSS